MQKSVSTANLTPLYRCGDNVLRTPAEMTRDGFKLPGATAMDAAPARRKPATALDGLTTDQMQTLTELFKSMAPKPQRQVRRSATAAAFDSEAGQFASNTELNDRYRKLKEQRGAYQYSGR